MGVWTTLLVAHLECRGKRGVPSSQPSNRVLAPLPAAFVAPWLEDNHDFINDLAFMGFRLAEHVPKLRDELGSAGRIRLVEPAQPMALSAVDAAVVAIELMDQVSVLFQMIRVDDDGRTKLGKPQRVSGINGHETQMLRTPLRVAMECRELAASGNLTIADSSYWSFLMRSIRQLRRARQRTESKGVT